ncbi:hypothetical protein K505DRAFT_261626, partial [Melanomma pulvis-pyrius CBS 109.77]
LICLKEVAFVKGFFASVVSLFCYYSIKIYFNLGCNCLYKEYLKNVIYNLKFNNRH